MSLELNALKTVQNEFYQAIDANASLNTILEIKGRLDLIKDLILRELIKGVNHV